MSEAEYDRVSAKITFSNKKEKYEFGLSGSTLVFDGFLKVYGNKSADVLIPSLKKGQVLKMTSL